MKKYLITLLLFLPFVFTSSVYAQSKSSRSGETVEIRSDEIIDHDYFISGDTVYVNGEINGDLYAAGGTVNISGKVNGDLLVAAGSVNISGEVVQDVRAAGGNIVISGIVGRNVTLIGGNVELAKSASLAGSIAIGAGNVNINSKIPGNVNLAAGSVFINSEIDGNIEAGVGQLTIASGASVIGDVNYYSDEEAVIDKSASVSGTIVRNDPTVHFKDRSTEDARNRISNFGKSFGRGVRLIGFISALIVAFIIVRFFPKCLINVSNVLRTSPMKSAGVGTIALFGVPIVVIALMLTIIGIPLAMLIIVIYLIYIYMTKIFLSYVFGKFLLTKASIKGSDYLIVTIGLIFYTLISFMPFLGGLFKFLTLLAGLGALIISSRSSYFDLKKKGLL